MHIDVQIANIDAQISDHTLLFHYWIGMATSGAATQRKITQGSGIHERELELTDDEKIVDAMKNASLHIDMVRELNEKKIELIEGKFTGKFT